MCLIAQPVQRKVGRGMAKKILGVSWNYMKMCFKILYFPVLFSVFSQLAWAYFSASIIMIFVGCTNSNGYLRNYLDCLTLGTHHVVGFLYITANFV
jgi:hypothetical protein